MLDDAGWLDSGDGVRERRGARLDLHLLVSQNDALRTEVARREARDLEGVGIRCEVREIQASELGQRLRSGAFEAYVGQWFPDAEGGLDPGPPMLLLHGYPQTHAMWHRIATRLAERHTVVCADLRGYGDSSKTVSDATHAAYSKRAMAQDMVELMRALGHATFRLVGHDRGGRVAHRLCVDHPEAVERVAVLDISPTRAMYRGTTQAFATAYYHWFFLIQPFDLPERLIGADPGYYLRRKLGGWGSSASVFDPRAFAEYERCFADPGTIHPPA